MNKKYNFVNIDYPITDNYVDFNYLLPHFLDQLKNDNKSAKYISVIAQFKGIEGDNLCTKTLCARTPLDLYNNKEVKNFIISLNEKQNTLTGLYSIPLILMISFNYTIINENDYQLGINTTKAIKISNNIAINYNNDIESPANLPLDTVYESWGKTDYNTGAGEYMQIKYVKNFRDSVIKIFPKERDGYRESNTIQIETKTSNEACGTLTDIIVNKNTSEFIRKYNNKIYHIINKKVYFLFEKISPSKYISSLTPSKISPSIPMVLDIETYLDENSIMKVYCIVFYDGTKTKSYYLTDFSNIEELLSKLFKDILTVAYSGKIIYIHNSSKFDLVFLLKPLSNITEISDNSIIKDGKFIDLRVLFGSGNKYCISFRDSMLLLPSSLKDLTSSFKVGTSKDIFPHRFVNKDTLNYNGPVPEYIYFDSNKTSITDYKEYCQRFSENWSLKDEAIKYCEKDCISLFEVIVNFGNKIYELFKVNIDKCPTLPSLTFRIFRTCFLSKGVRIPILADRIYKDISKAYFGGHVDMYIPKNNPGELIYQYDINSLYPSEMKVKKYPNDIIGYFKGDISKMNEYIKLYTGNVGFFKVRVEAPANIQHPILPIKLDGTTIYPSGEWISWYYSEEIENAKKFGYQFQILEGYIFRKADIFSNFIEAIYKTKEKSMSGTPEYTISKLILNSLYGRFGMSPDRPLHLLTTKTKEDSTINKLGLHNIISTTELGNKVLFSYYPKFKRNSNINIALASAITSNSRIKMSEFKNNPDFILYYSDTDCIFINKQLNPNLVDPKKLGLFKLEHVISNFVALGPKTYGFITIEGDEIIKTKGYSKNISYNELESLLKKDNITKLNLTQKKWFNNFSEGIIEEKTTTFSLKPTSYKRELTFNNNVLIGTSNKIVFLSDQLKKEEA